MTHLTGTGRWVIGAVFTLIFFGGNAAWGSESREWRFNVLLDGKPIGYHHFTVSPDKDALRVRSRAQFNVRFLFFEAYVYEHENTELWRDGCLARIDASTNDNGKRSRIAGDAAASQFRITTDDGMTTLEPCVRSFAYWDRAALGAAQLLNPQTGKYLPVQVRDLGSSRVTVGGATLQAHHVRLEAEAMAIDLWYAEDGHWIALESTTEGGRRLRYEPEILPDSLRARGAGDAT